MFKPFLRLLVTAVFASTLAIAAGCSTEHSTTTTTTTTADPPTEVASNDGAATPQNAPASTSTTTEATKDEPDSVAGSVFHAVGTIILFPFRVIGDVLGLIF